MDRRSTAKKSGQKIPLGREAVVRIPGKVIERAQRTFGIVKMVSLAILVGQPQDGFEAALSPNRLKKLQQRNLALAAHGEVHIAGVQRGFGVIGWKVSAPRDGRLRKAGADFTAGFDRAARLRARHDGHGQEFDRPFPQERGDGFRRTWV